MSTSRKYVIGQPRRGTHRPTAIIFDDVFAHNEMATMFNPDTIVGAGFFYQDTDAHGNPKVVVHGSSVSLKLASRPEDALYLEVVLGHRYFDDRDFQRQVRKDWKR